MSVPNSPPTMDATVRRGEWCVVLAIVTLAALLRFTYSNRLAVEHFDEGVYASNIWFGNRPEGVYPAQHLYAPPLLPALIEWIFVFSGPSNWGAMLPNQIAGTATVLLMWWLGRSWFGPVAGLTAATLCAANEVHILLSRSALTDALLGLWWVAALLALRRACDSGRWSDRLIAGILLGLAWYTKYNGWMPLAITLGAVTARGIVCRGIWNQTRRSLLSCLVVGLIAFSLWSPWLWHLQAHGGYSTVAANHRQYVVGLAGWPGSFGRQWEQLAATMEVLSIPALVVSYFSMYWAAVRRVRDLGLDPDRELYARDPSTIPPSLIYHFTPYVTWRWTFLWVLGCVLFPTAGPVLLAVQGMVLWAVWSRYRNGDRLGIRIDDLGYWIVVVWFAGLLFVTPLYRPYLRLTLPWTLSSCVASGLAIHLAWQSVWCELCSFASYRLLRSEALSRVVAVILLGIGVVFLRHTRDRTHFEWNSPIEVRSDRSGVADAAGQIVARIERDTNRSDSSRQPTVVYVYAEPGLLFQLRLAGLLNVGPVSSLQFADRQFSGDELRVYLVAGVHAKSDPRFVDQIKHYGYRLKRTGSWQWHLGLLVALDQSNVDPNRLGTDPHETTTIDLYEVLPP